MDNGRLTIDKEISNFKSQISNDKGFTLVEILVVISVLSVVGVIILTIFTRTLKGNNKAQILSAIKQNGQAVLENMDKTIRSSGNLLCPTIDPSNTLVVEKDGLYTRYRVAQNMIVSDNPAKQIDPDTNKDETDTAFKNRVCGSADTMTSADILTDTNSQSGVLVDCIESDCNTNPIFQPNKLAGFKDAVTIKFQLSHALNAPPAVAGQIDPVTFQTTIQLR